MVVNARSLKRMRRRVTAGLHDFLRFPTVESGVRIAGGPFRSNISAFLTHLALLPPPSSLLPHLVTWQVPFRVGDAADLVAEYSSPSGSPVLCLYVVEEDVARSRSVYCNQCRVVGWSEHPVCTKRYHFILKPDGNSIGGFNKPCPKCGGEVNHFDPRCKACNYLITSDDVEDWVYQQLEDTTHLLHGVVHVNGYGHLLRVNGREGGSQLLSGSHIMDFWDRLCKYLGVRRISVMDVSKKYGLEYRLLHAVIKGRPWYGNWGYEFGSGSFALTHNAYVEAVEIMSSLQLSVFTCQGRRPRTRIHDLILFYQSLSERELVNTRDLFSFLTSLVHDEHYPLLSEGDFKRRRTCAPGVLCVWTSIDIKRVEAAMMRVLSAVTGNNWVSWRNLKGALCKVGSPELLDYCLKGLGGKQTPAGGTVNARCNPDTGALEFRLEHGSIPFLGNQACVNGCPSREQILQDMKFLYECMLHPQTVVKYGPEVRGYKVRSAASRLLDCKHFVKDFNPETTKCIGDPSLIHLTCQVEFAQSSNEQVTRPPPELIALSLDSTISDLKAEASKAFQEVYITFKGFQAEELVDYQGVEESALVNLLFNPRHTVRIRGSCPVKSGLGRFRLERGVERWTVDCACGARDDDGERMLACDICSVWQHTRCSGISDFESVPVKFQCRRCKTVSRTGFASISLNCKDESMVVGLGAPCGGKAMAMLFDAR